METLTNCPNCDAELKDGMFSFNSLSQQNTSKTINAFTDNKAVAHCGKCAPALFDKARKRWTELMPETQQKLSDILPYVPLVSVHNPQNWDYDVVKMVTAQSVTGTGVLSELSASWNDFFGQQSNRLNSKIKEGENLCMSKLQLEAAEAGANAVIGCDIDYAEVGGGRGMLMVCMAGTAVKIKNIDILGEDAKKELEAVNKTAATMKYLLKFKPVFEA